MGKTLSFLILNVLQNLGSSFHLTCRSLNFHSTLIWETSHCSAKTNTGKIQPTVKLLTKILHHYLVKYNNGVKNTTALIMSFPVQLSVPYWTKQKRSKKIITYEKFVFQVSDNQNIEKKILHERSSNINSRKWFSEKTIFFGNISNRCWRYLKKF